MYQLTISLNSKYTDWLCPVKNTIAESSIAEQSVCIYSEENGVFYISIGAEPHCRQKIIGELKECLAKIYLTVVKKEYITNKLRLGYSSDISQLLIISTLVAFDRENEERTLLDDLDIKSKFSMDGFFHFRMSELKSRWDDVCRLASDNAKYLSSDNTVNELLKFLLSAVNPKVSKAEVFQNGNKFRVSVFNPEFAGESEFDNFEQLMLYMIDAAPLKTVLRGNFDNRSYYERLSFVFDAAENIL